MTGARLVPIAGLLVVLATPAASEIWLSLGDGQIGPALAARVVGYTDGTVQDFKADGTSLFQSFWSLRHGFWKVEGGRYCSQWPPRDDWTCYRVEREDRGRALRFIDEAGQVTTGRYLDLQ